MSHNITGHDIVANCVVWVMVAIDYKPDLSKLFGVVAPILCLTQAVG